MNKEEEHREKTLMGVHNISLEKLLKALRQGGFANPSMAVVNTENGILLKYGEISLISPKALIDKETGHNAGTFRDDAYSPRYPETELRMSRKGASKYFKEMSVLADRNKIFKELWSDISYNYKESLEGHPDYNATAAWFLADTGRQIPAIYKQLHYPEEYLRRLNDIATAAFENERYFNTRVLYNLPKDKLTEAMEVYKDYIQHHFYEVSKQSEYDHRVARAVRNLEDHKGSDSEKEFRRRYDETVKYGGEKDYIFKKLELMSHYAPEVDVPRRIDAFKTFDASRDLILSNNLQNEFESWKDRLIDRYEEKEYFYVGTDSRGNHRYKRNTLENASAFMKKQGLAGGEGWTSFGSFAAKRMGTLSSTEEIEFYKDQIREGAAERKPLEDLYFDLCSYVSKGISSTFPDRIVDAIASSMNPAQFAKKEYNLNLSQEYLDKQDRLIKGIRKMPTLYFETKFQRPVMINEFSKAIVPDNTPDDVVHTLMENGLLVYKYKAGDEENRQHVTITACKDDSEIMFQKASSHPLKPSENEKDLRNTLITILRSSGIEVIDDKEEGQKILSDSYTGEKGLKNQEPENSDGLRHFKTSDGKDSYGFTLNGKIYIDPDIATSETPIHEYTHLWASALRHRNPQEWKNIVGLMKGEKELWAKVSADYPELKTDDDIADEVLATYSGRRGAQRLHEEGNKILQSDKTLYEKGKALGAIQNLKGILARFWKDVYDFLHIHYDRSEQVADRAMRDLLSGVNPLDFIDRKELTPYLRNMAFGDSYDYERFPLGRVEPGLNSKSIKIVQTEPEHGFKNIKAARSWAKNNISRLYTPEETGGKGYVNISRRAIDKFLSKSAIEKSESLDVHFAALKVLPSLIKESIDAETHPNFRKGDDLNRHADNGYDKEALIHRIYGAILYKNLIYRVKITAKEDTKRKKVPHNIHSYEALKIELLTGTCKDPDKSECLPKANNPISVAKLLKDVEMSYNPGVKLLKESLEMDKLLDLSTIRNQIIGEGGAARLDKNTGKNIIMNLHTAKDMKKSGKDPLAIRLATGWEQGADFNWRYEIPDMQDFSVTGSLRGKKEGEEKTLPDYIDFPELFKAYPVFLNTPVSIESLSGNTLAEFKTFSERENGEVVIDKDVMGKALDDSAVKEKVRNLFIHEIQHGIQELEGFALGGSPAQFDYESDEALVGIEDRLDELRNEGRQDTEEYRQLSHAAKILDNYEIGESVFVDGVHYRNAFDAYQALSGETEARNAAARSSMSSEDRRKTLLSSTEDYPRVRQIVQFEPLGARAELSSKDIQVAEKEKLLVEKEQNNYYSLVSLNTRDEIDSEAFSDPAALKYAIDQKYDCYPVDLANVCTIGDIFPDLKNSDGRESRERTILETHDYLVAKDKDDDGIKTFVKVNYDDIVSYLTRMYEETSGEMNALSAKSLEIFAREHENIMRNFESGQKLIVVLTLGNDFEWHAKDTGYDTTDAIKFHNLPGQFDFGTADSKAITGITLKDGHLTLEVSDLEIKNQPVIESKSQDDLFTFPGDRYVNPHEPSLAEIMPEEWKNDIIPIIERRFGLSARLGDGFEWVNGTEGEEMHLPSHWEENIAKVDVSDGKVNVYGYRDDGSGYEKFSGIPLFGDDLETFKKTLINIKEQREKNVKNTKSVINIAPSYVKVVHNGRWHEEGKIRHSDENKNVVNKAIEDGSLRLDKVQKYEDRQMTKPSNEERRSGGLHL